MKRVARRLADGRRLNRGHYRRWVWRCQQDLAAVAPLPMIRSTIKLTARYLRARPAVLRQLLGHPPDVELVELAGGGDSVGEAPAHHAVVGLDGAAKLQAIDR